MREAVAQQAGAAMCDAFAEACQDWVRRMPIDHAVITVERHLGPVTWSDVVPERSMCDC